MVAHKILNPYLTADQEKKDNYQQNESNVQQPYNREPTRPQPQSNNNQQSIQQLDFTPKRNPCDDYLRCAFDFSWNIFQV